MDNFQADREDYQKFLHENNITEEFVRAASENKTDQIPFLVEYNIEVAVSAIQGSGLFSTKKLVDPGSIIAPARIGDMRTPAGRYANHSASPNAIMRKIAGTIYLVSISKINDGDEIAIDYRESMKILENEQNHITKTSDKRILDLEKTIIDRELEQVEPPIEHIFAPGLYIRKMVMPAGCLVIGKRHRHVTCNMLSAGEMSIMTSDQSSGEQVTAPYFFNTDPNVKKMLYSHTECIFLNIHPNPTNETNVDQLEKEFIIDEDEYKNKTEVS